MNDSAAQIATLVHEGFDTFYDEFKRLTRQCRQWFDTRDWIRLHEKSHIRIDLYQRYVSRTLASLRASPDLTTDTLGSQDVWKSAHRSYEAITRDRVDYEVAQTFFNAITRKIFGTVGVNREIEFLETDLSLTSGPGERPELFGRFRRRDDLQALLVDVLRHPRPALTYKDIAGEAQYLEQRLRENLRARFGDDSFDHLDVLKALFFRVREAYIVVRISRGGEFYPLVIPIQSVSGGMVVDGALSEIEDILPVFSSTRSYMFVDVGKPIDLVRFLGTLMPQLTMSELYVAIAHHRHGKTLIYRELVEHVERSDDQFIVAPGIRGLVMTVFTLPSYRNVFKIIRDSFDKPGATREAILQSYRDVFRGRRVGRLADTQEFEHLAFDRDRFTPQCLEELVTKAGNTVRVVGDKVVVKHLYIEEKMTPLDIYLTKAPVEEAEKAIIDYGYAIKELAANNIFAGDLLWKNFGVTAYGRLVLYDYDEICPLLDCNFRAIPQPRTWEDEMSSTPWYSVAPNDVFPEEWAPFIVPRYERRVAEAFLDLHTDLLGPKFWQAKQAEVLAGQLHIGLPYVARHPELQQDVVRGPRLTPRI